MWILVGALIALIGGFVSAYFAYKEGQTSQKQSDRIDNTVQNTDSRVKSLTEKTIAQERKIVSLGEELAKANKRTIEEMEKANLAQRQMIDYTTGGDSFPYLHISDWADNKGTVYIVNSNSRNHSFNPLQHVTVYIIRLSVFSDLLLVQKKTPKEIRDESTVLKMTINWLSPHSSIDIGQIDLGEFEGGERKFNAFIEANGRYYAEQIVIRKKLGKFYCGFSLREGNDKIIRTSYQPGFLDIDEKEGRFYSKTIGRFVSDENGNLTVQ